MGARVRPVSFSVKVDVLDKLTMYCEENGCSRSWFVSKALESYLAQCLEDKADYERAVSAWDDFVGGDGKTFTSADLRAEFGL